MQWLRTTSPFLSPWCDEKWGRHCYPFTLRCSVCRERCWMQTLVRMLNLRLDHATMTNIATFVKPDMQSRSYKAYLSIWMGVQLFAPGRDSWGLSERTCNKLEQLMNLVLWYVTGVSGIYHYTFWRTWRERSPQFERRESTCSLQHARPEWRNEAQ